MAIQKAAIEKRSKQEGTLAKDASGIITYAKNKIEWDLIDWQAKVKVLNELAQLNNDEKLEAVFLLLDVDGNKKIDAYELMEQRRKFRSFMGMDTDFQQSLRFAAREISSYDQDGDSMLNMEEFKVLVKRLADKQTDNTSVPEMCEILVFSLLFEDPQDCHNKEECKEEPDSGLDEAMQSFIEKSSRKAERNL